MKIKEKKIKKVTTAKKSKKSVKSKDLGQVTTDEFFDDDFQVEDDEDVEAEHDSDSGESELDPKEHKKALKNLANTDPEFYKFLEQNDKKLLEFEDSEDENERASDQDDDDDDDDGIHVPDGNLAGNSDESDYEETEVIKNQIQGRVKVTLKLIKKWQEDIQTDKSMQTMKCIVDAFHAALLTVADPEESKNVEYKVEGSAAFNGVVQLCVMNLPTAFKKFLKMTNESKFEAHKCKRFGKVKGILKQYLKDLLQILENVTSTDVQVVLLKHLHQMICFTGSFSSLNKPLLRILLRFWSSGEETVRIVAYLSIIQMATSRKESILDNLFRTMYIKYVENSKFVSPNSMPGINFMRRSLAEIYMLDQNLAYNHAFLYIRQLAIHLRNALTLKKKELFQAVYNWQYINSLRFWCQIMSLSKNGSMLRSLLYPLVQIITGTIKLIPTAQYYPLRFHCCQMLINLSKETGTFIPILPFLLDVLNTYDFNKKHQRSQMKHMSFMCLLRASKIQLKESNFKNAIVDDIYQLILEHAANESHSIYFSDLYVPCTMQMKVFLKKCKVANFCKKIKQLLDKIQENRQFVETERNKVVINLSDLNTIKNFENQLKVIQSPLSKFYESWYKLHLSQKLKFMTNNDDLGDYNLPSLKSRKRLNDSDNDHDSDLDMAVEEMNELLEKQATRKNKTKKIKISHKSNEVDETANDVVKDTKIDDWD
ncbi:Similar to CG9246: Nucleolar complex protein 2 homolog (Drosophila melanogaster) [Cotesia congregata]|uniref:Similar to CG9246: Nucleolar complex protein 2 homolog (Drosophila melanogaster) n=1 Tax=Cotesia congregata TaxID=51543 RepID=A0A8J2EMB0_COTCN|nr:Similar to CG9246: Nucleolar complex protein 2 homolog (Drosophila melanogaster) [Cotesia congregata]